MLDFADFCWRGHPESIASGPENGPSIGVECSTVSDLLGKIKTNRLGFQCEGMKELYDISFFYVTEMPFITKAGTVQAGYGISSGFTWANVQSALYSCMAHGTYIVFGHKRDDLAHSISLMYNYWQKPAAEHKSFRKGAVKQLLVMESAPDLDPRIKGLMNARGVGEKMARLAVETFGSIANACLMPEVAIRSLKGFGPETAHNLYAYLHATSYAEVPSAPTDPLALDPELEASGADIG